MAKNYSFSVVLESQEDGGFAVLVPRFGKSIPKGIQNKKLLRTLKTQSAWFSNIGGTMTFRFPLTCFPKFDS
jgi:hypothetical protein